MQIFIIVFIVTVLVFALLWMVYSKRRAEESDAPEYICHTCNHRDCICEKTDTPKDS